MTAVSAAQSRLATGDRCPSQSDTLHRALHGLPRRTADRGHVVKLRPRIGTGPGLSTPDQAAPPAGQAGSRPLPAMTSSSADAPTGTGSAGPKASPRASSEPGPDII